MRVIHDMAEFEGKGCVAALGTFDGVHIGHQRLIREAVSLARDMGLQSVVCTFDRHPLSVLRPQRAPRSLLTPEENLAKFERLEVDVALVYPFTAAFSETPAEKYLHDLVAELGAKAIVVGENHTFGAGGRGNAEMIRALATELGYRAVVVPPVMDGDQVCSSSHIRALLDRGELARAEGLMRIDGA